MGVSAYPQSVTLKMMANFLAGTAASIVMADRVGADWRVIDCGVAGDIPAHARLLERKIAKGTKNFIFEPAMALTEVHEAVTRGRQLIRQLSMEGCNTFLMGEMGIGNTSSAALIAHCLTGSPLDSLVGYGTGLTEEGRHRKQKLLAQAMARLSAAPRDPLKVLAEFGGFEIATMAGAYLECYETGSVAVVDGLISSAAALVAVALGGHPILDAMIWSHQSPEPGQECILRFLGQKPLLSLGLRLGEGTGALLTLPLLHCAADLMAKMANLEHFGIEPLRSTASGLDGEP